MGLKDIHQSPVSVQDFPDLPASGVKASSGIKIGEVRSTIAKEKVASVAQNWKELFSVQEDNVLEYFEPVVVGGRARVKPPREVLEEGANQWKNAVVAQCLGRISNLAQFQRAISLMWGKDGDIEIMPAGTNVFIIQFKDDDVCNKVVEGGPWQIQNCLVIVRKWQPGFSSLDFKMDRIPVWVNLYCVPLEYFNQKGLSYVASAIGRPLHMDNFTARKRKVVFARVCIEVDLRREIPKEIEVDLMNGKTAIVSVEVPWTPHVCRKCNNFGHETSSCPRKMERTEWRVKKPAPAPAKEVELGTDSDALKRKGKGKMSVNNGGESVDVLKNQFALLGAANEANGSCSKQNDHEEPEKPGGDESLMDQADQSMNAKADVSTDSTKAAQEISQPISPRKSRAASAGVSKLMAEIKKDQQEQIGLEVDAQKIEGKGRRKGRKKAGKADGDNPEQGGTLKPSFK